MNIFVARLNYETESDRLREVFEAFGEVDSAKVIFDKFTGRSRGFGFVTFEDDEGAYDQKDAAGFIKLNALRLRTLAARNRRG